MKDLIAALQILAKYMPDMYAPTHCINEVLLVMFEGDVSDEDKAELKRLGFEWILEYEYLGSYRFGSCLTEGEEG